MTITKIIRGFAKGVAGTVLLPIFFFFPFCPCFLPFFSFFSVFSFRFLPFFLREAPDTFNVLRHVMRAILSVRPKCSHRCVSLKETPL